MGKPVGCTQKGRVTQWLRANPGRYSIRYLMRHLHVGRSAVYAALDEARANGWAEAWAAGRNTTWRVHAHES